MNKNIIYKSSQLAEFYSKNRSSYDALYPSERVIFERAMADCEKISVLDVGCACGGLGVALTEKFDIAFYHGVDINSEMIEWARKNQRLSCKSEFKNADILDVGFTEQHDIVVSLSCVDWNIESNSMIEKCWELVKPGGKLILSIRLTTRGGGVNDITRSWQTIEHCHADDNAEIANYVVYDIDDLFAYFMQLKIKPTVIGGYGYWGTPSATAVTPYEKLVFSVFYLTKPEQSCGDSISTNVDIKLPVELFV